MWSPKGTTLRVIRCPTLQVRQFLFPGQRSDTFLTDHVHYINHKSVQHSAGCLLYSVSCSDYICSSNCTASNCAASNCAASKCTVSNCTVSKCCLYFTLHYLQNVLQTAHNPLPYSCCMCCSFQSAHSLY